MQAHAPICRRPGRRAAGGFTLVELLVVIVVIGILAAGVFKMMGTANNKAAIAKTTAQVHAIASLLEEYKAIYGDYPRVTTQYLYDDEPIGYAALNYHFVSGEGDDAHPSYGNSGTSNTPSGLQFRIRTKSGSVRNVNPTYACGTGDEITFGLCSHFVPRATLIREFAKDELRSYYTRQFQKPKGNSPYELEMRGNGSSDALNQAIVKESVDPNLQQIYRAWRRLEKDGVVVAQDLYYEETGTTRFNAGASNDAWGRPLVYKNDGGAGEIVSAGPDGIFGTSDDIASGGAAVDEGDED